MQSKACRRWVLPGRTSLKTWVEKYMTALMPANCCSTKRATPICTPRMPSSCRVPWLALLPWLPAQDSAVFAYLQSSNWLVLPPLFHERPLSVLPCKTLPQIGMLCMLVP